MKLTLTLFLLGIFCLPAFSEVRDENSHIAQGTNISKTKNLNYQDEITITGNITDGSNGQPLPGVNVTLKGTTTGTISDLDGNYSISVPSAEAVLVYSFVGFLNEEVAIGSQSSIDVALIPDITALDQVVVVGYGTQSKATVTGSISAVDGEELAQSPTMNLSNSLAGRVSGLVAVQRSGEPGSDNSTLRVRGLNTLRDNSPLVVVDGIPNRSMNRLDPADIESLTVLKDASAAIYGARAANGVILITTKRGQSGRPTVKLNYNQGFSQPSRIPEMCNAPEYMTLINEIRPNTYDSARIAEYDNPNADPWLYPNTNWLDETFKPWATQNSLNASISGGTEKVNYYLSLGKRFQDAIYKNSATNFKQYNFRSNIDAQVTDNIKIGLDINGRQETLNNPTRASHRIFASGLQSYPYVPAYWPDGTPGPDINGTGNNPVIISTDATGYSKTNNYTFETNLRLHIDIPWVKGLSLTGNGAFDKWMQNSKEFKTSWDLYDLNTPLYEDTGEVEFFVSQGGSLDPELQQGNIDQYRTTGNMLANYELDLGDHYFKILAGVEYMDMMRENFSAYRRYFISDEIDQLFAGGDLEKDNNGSASQDRRLNYFGRVNYNFKEKYLLEFVWRRDGSPTKFDRESGNAFGFFPGISAGWRLSEEDFWKNNISLINYMKIRGSWGQTGNDRVAPYQYLSSYEFTTYWHPSRGSNGIDSYAFGGIDSEVGGTVHKALTNSGLPNYDITWEVANQSNIGFDMQLLNGMFAIEADYFKYKRDKILINQSATTPETSGITSALLPDKNIGIVSNQGFEYVVTWRKKVGDWGFDISTNGSFSTSKVEFWNETPGRPEWQVHTGKIIASSPLNPDNDLYYESVGIFRDEDHIESLPHMRGTVPGDIIFNDKDENDTIDARDMVRVNSNNMPKFTAGFNFAVSYKQFDFSFLVQGAAGAKLYLNMQSGIYANFLKEFYDTRWTEENPNSEGPRTYDRNSPYWKDETINRNTYFLRSTDYIRLKNVEIGYNTPQSFNQRLNIGGVRLYINGQNLLTIDKLKVFDPELNNSSGLSYPTNRIVNAGITLTL